MKVDVQNDRLDKALKIFKKKIEDSGILKEVRDREQYIKPSENRKLKKNAARKRWLKKLDQSKLPTRKF